MAYDQKGNWVDEPGSGSTFKSMFPSYNEAWSDARELGGLAADRGDYGTAAERYIAGAGGALAGLSNDVNPVNKVINWMNKTPAQPGYMKTAIGVGPGVDRATGKSTWVDSKSAPSYQKMASALADMSSQRVGFQQQDPYGALPDRFSQSDTGGQFMTGSAPGQIPLGREGGFFSGSRAYNVNDSSQAGISKVTSRGANPLYTNIDPEQGVAGLKQQMVGGNAADVQQGLDRFARANATWKEVVDKQPTGGVGVLADQNEADNAEKTQRWAMEDAVSKVPYAQRGQAMMRALESMQNNQTQRRGQDLNFAGQAAGQGIQARGQDMQYRSHVEGLGLQGRNQAEHDTRVAENARGLEKYKQQLDDGNPLKAAQAKAYEAHAKLYGNQADQMEREAAYGKTPHAQYMRQLELLGKGAERGDPVATQMYQDALAKLAYFNKQNGYADGGQVETPEQVMARIQAKYGVSGTPQPQAQAQAPQPVRQQAQPQQPPGGLMDRLRSVATGGLDRRMQAAGFAEGGPIAVGGRPVVGAGNGKSDSLPAVIDGEHPAALSTGEFVMPVEAVRHFGLDRLNKMVAAARKGLDTGRESE